MSENENLYDISARIEKSEPVSPAELRAWVNYRGPRPFGDGKYGQYTRDVITRYQVLKLDEAATVKKQDGGGRLLKADEQREFNRLLAEGGEIGLILNQADEQDREQKRRFRERFPDGLGGGWPDTRGQNKGVILPSFQEYKSQSIASGPGGGYLVPEVNAGLPVFRSPAPAVGRAVCWPARNQRRYRNHALAEDRQQRHGGRLRRGRDDHGQ